MGRAFLQCAILLASSILTIASAEPKKVVLQGPEGRIRLRIARNGLGANEVVEVNDKGKWVSALSASDSATRVFAGSARELKTCAIESLEEREEGQKVVILSNCGVGRLTRILTTTAEPDVVAVDVVFTSEPGIATHSVDR
jgi:hypothetical protein